MSYNVRPLRTKDRVYLDVLSESLNNPIRLLMGWAMIDSSSLPPVSLLGDCKRLSEWRDIAASGGRETLALYRRSFARYDEARLSTSYGRTWVTTV